MVSGVPDVSAPAHADPLSAYTTLRVGGPAGRLITATTEEQIVAGVRDAARAGVPTLVLAGGSNVVVSDAGFPGTVVLLRSNGCTVAESDASVELTVHAGAPWDEVVATAAESGWAGIECLSGVPGSTGAPPIQTVGAYGQAVAETLAAARAPGRRAQQAVPRAAAERGFGSRTSRFKSADRWVVLAARFRLPRSPLSTRIRYAELGRALDVP